MHNRRALSLVAGLVSLLTASVVRADYVDFRTDTWGSFRGGFTTEVNGVQVAVTQLDDIWVSTWWHGLYMYGNSYASFEDRNSYAGALAITFSSPVDIVSVDLFDYYRNSYARCYADSCPLLSSDSPHLGTYAVDGFPTSTIVASAPSSSSSNSGSVTSGAQGSPYTYSWAEAGWGYKDNDVADYTFTKDINQTGSRIVFTGSLVGYDSPPEGLDYADRYTAYGISGITFSSTQVPELSSSGATTGLTLILGALLIVTQRRQSAQRTDVFRPVAPASRKTSVGFPSGLS